MTRTRRQKRSAKEQPAEIEDRPSSEGAEESTAGSEVEDPERQEEPGSEERSDELGIVVPETRQGEVDPVKIAEALHEMSKVNLDYQRRRLAEGRGIEEFQNDPEIRRVDRSARRKRSGCWTRSPGRDGSRTRLRRHSRSG